MADGSTKKMKPTHNSASNPLFSFGIPDKVKSDRINVHPSDGIRNNFMQVLLVRSQRRDIARGIKQHWTGILFVLHIPRTVAHHSNASNLRQRNRRRRRSWIAALVQSHGSYTYRTRNSQAFAQSGPKNHQPVSHSRSNPHE